jgi:hypothetical protein
LLILAGLARDLDTPAHRFGIVAHELRGSGLPCASRPVGARIIVTLR